MVAGWPWMRSLKLQSSLWRRPSSIKIPSESLSSFTKQWAPRFGKRTESSILYRRHHHTSTMGMINRDGKPTRSRISNRVFFFGLVASSLLIISPAVFFSLKCKNTDSRLWQPGLPAISSMAYPGDKGAVINDQHTGTEMFCLFHMMRSIDNGGAFLVYRFEVINNYIWLCTSTPTVGHPGIRSAAGVAARQWVDPSFHSARVMKVDMRRLAASASPSFWSHHSSRRSVSCFP